MLLALIIIFKFNLIFNKNVNKTEKAHFYKKFIKVGRLYESIDQ